METPRDSEAEKSIKMYYLIRQTLQRLRIGQKRRQRRKERLRGELTKGCLLLLHRIILLKNINVLLYEISLQFQLKDFLQYQYNVLAMKKGSHRHQYSIKALEFLLKARDHFGVLTVYQ